MQIIHPRPVSDDDGKPNHPDVMERKDPVADVTFANMMRHFDTDTGLVRLSLDMARGLSKNDPPQPPPLSRDEYAEAVGLDTLPANTASFGPFGGMAFMDHDGDVASVWLAKLQGRAGVIFTANGESVFLPIAVWNDMHKRMINYSNGHPDVRQHRWTVPDEYNPWPQTDTP